MSFNTADERCTAGFESAGGLETVVGGGGGVMGGGLIRRPDKRLGQTTRTNDSDKRGDSGYITRRRPRPPRLAAETYAITILFLILTLIMILIRIRIPILVVVVVVVVVGSTGPHRRPARLRGGALAVRPGALLPNRCEMGVQGRLWPR